MIIHLQKRRARLIQFSSLHVTHEATVEWMKVATVDEVASLASMDETHTNQSVKNACKVLLYLCKEPS